MLVKMCVSLVQWLMSVIPATWELESQKFMVQGQPGQKVSEIPSQYISWMWWHAPVVPAMWKTIGRRITVHPSYGQKHETLCKK
jgi:hypothetical protein